MTKREKEDQLLQWFLEQKQERIKQLRQQLFGTK
jgi:hypothetical protein